MSLNPRRVVITGVGVVSPLGHSAEQLNRRLCSGESSIVKMSEWQTFGLASLVASPVKDFDGAAIPRQKRRSMSRVAQFAVTATGQAIRVADLSEDLIQSDRTGISYGSTMGGTTAIDEFYRSYIETGSVVQGVMSTTFLKIMSHTCATNIAVAFSIPGRIIASCTACAASTQAIGFGYEAIKYGMADRMICGGAEELHVAITGVFDVMRATSTGYNDQPQKTPKPFCSKRDGIVVGEGAGTLILEEYDLAKKRGAKIYGEIVGFGTNADANHMTNPSIEGMEQVMNMALRDANLQPQDISYINAHGTGTKVGDISESNAIYKVFGNKVPVSSFKGYFGHLMGACGVIELIGCLGLMSEHKILPTLNHDTIDPECGHLNYVRFEPQIKEQNYILKNSFAFGGINTSLVVARVN